jgi:hypothetical protein
VKTEHFYKVSAIRQQARAGLSIAALSARFNLPEFVLNRIIATRTIEGATKLLEIPESYESVKRFVLVEGCIYDFTALIGTDYV